MKKADKEVKKGVKNKGRFILVFLLVLLILSSSFLIYNLLKLRVLENFVKLFNVIIGFLVFIDLIFLLKVRKRFKKKKKRKLNKEYKNGLLITFMILYFVITLLISIVIVYGYSFVSGFNKDYVTYSSSLVVMSDSSINNISDLKNCSIGILDDKKSPDGYIIPQEMIKDYKLQDENSIKKYDNYSSMIADLYSENLDAIFISTDYTSMFSSIEDYANISNDTRIVKSKEKDLVKKNTSKKELQSIGKNVREPFTILLMGVDSAEDGLGKNTVANGDSLILITFNPKTLNATMISIPRDSYVPIACWSGKPENKITHAAAYGTDCMMETIENYFDVTIDYYAKINFKGLVKLVDALGGIDVEVPKDLCTDDSNRGGVVCIKEGFQHLNGEEALVLARNRKQLANGDIGRGQNQQVVIQGMVNKIKTIRSAKSFLNILDTISSNFDTNLTTDQILSFYNIAEDLMNNNLAQNDSNLVNIQQLYLQGYGQTIYDENARMALWNYVPNPNSRKDIIKAMKINLGLLNHEVDKSFSFSINEEYEKTIIGEGPYNNSYGYSLVPNFIGYSESVARSVASRNGVKVSFIGSGGVVISQSVPEKKRVDKLSSAVVLTLSNSGKKEETDKKTDKNNNKKPAKDTDKKTDEEEEKKEDTTPKEDKEQTSTDKKEESSADKKEDTSLKDNNSQSNTNSSSGEKNTSSGGNVPTE